MKEPRTIKELLQLMLDNVNLIEDGLCGLQTKLRCFDIITAEERFLIHNYIDHNRPSKFSSIDAFKNRGSLFYWERGAKEPRIKWLKNHIKKIHEKHTFNTNKQTK